MVKLQQTNTDSIGGARLRVYALGQIDFEAAQSFQQRLVYEVRGDRRLAALVLCEHPWLLSVGRQGSWAHVRGGLENKARHRWPVRWVNRGGGCILHLPGQLAIYPIFALDRVGLGVPEYLTRLQTALIAVLRDLSVRGTRWPEHAGVCVDNRPIAEMGIAVRDWVAYYGAVLNVSPDLEPLRLLGSGVTGCGFMTSLERERHGRVRPALVRELLIEHLSRQLGFSETIFFSDHPSLRRKAACDALASYS
jgi:lipoyl(octanoyl) transferase